MRGIVLRSDNVVHETKEKRFDELPFDMHEKLVVWECLFILSSCQS